MKNRLVLVVLLIVVIAGIGAFIGYRMWNKPPAQVEDVETASKTTATELGKAYAANETEANKQYQNKAVEITGTISDISKNQDGYVLLVLKGGGTDVEIACTLKEKEVKVAAGDVVTVKGFCSGGDMVFGVNVTDCIIVK